MTKRNIATAALTAAIAIGCYSAYATNSWNGYHWARTTSSFTLQTLDSTAANSNANWPALLANASSQWSASTVLNLNVTAYANDSRSRKRCTAVSGKIRVCNAAYGSNGWLGLASINLDSNGHISQGTAKMNDSYTSTWTSDLNEAPHVMCQEVGHTFGLDHTSTDGSSQADCMDYSSSPTSTKPSSHDMSELQIIYQHLDSYSSASTAFSAASANSMAGETPMGVMVHHGVFDETWAAPDGKGGMWIHHVYLAPGFEHVED